MSQYISDSISNIISLAGLKHDSNLGFSSATNPPSPRKANESSNSSTPGQMSGIAPEAPQASKSRRTIDLDADEDEDEYDPAPASTEIREKMNTRSGNTRSVRLTKPSSPFSGRRTRNDAQPEMDRLLGTSQKTKEGATPIPVPTRDGPRRSSQKKYGSFTPRDNLSPLPLHTSAGFNVRRPKPQESRRVDEPERKKRRTMPIQTIDMTIDDNESGSNTGGRRASRASNVSSSTTVNHHTSQRTQPNGVPEYREVEHSISIRKAARPRNSTTRYGDGFESSPSGYLSNETLRNGLMTVAQAKQNRSQTASKTQTTTSPYFSGRNGSTSPKLSEKFVPMDGKRRNSAVTPSDDELQGSATVRNQESSAIPIDEDADMLEFDHVEIVSRKPTTRIPQTHFTSSKAGSVTERPKKKAKQGVSHEYGIKQIRWQEFQIPANEKGLMAVNVAEKRFECHLVGSQLGPEVICECRTDKIQSIDHGHDPSRKARLRLSASSNRNEPVDLEFDTHKGMMDFIRDLQSLDPHVRVHARESRWIDNAFANREEAPALPSSTKFDTSLGDIEKHHYHKPSKDDTLRRPEVSESRVRFNMKDNLRAKGALLTERQSRENHSGTSQPSITTGRDRAGGTEEISSIERQLSRLNPKGMTTYGTPGRTTRSSTRKEDSLDSLLKFDHPKLDVGPQWKKPLIFPKEGKKRTEVEFKDLDRLNEHEFLNDNLIAFYMRYLEYYLEQDEPELSSKIYIFNSFFYERLTTTVKGKKGGINYAAVQKWTSKVDLFGYDFVVVPINENSHWYLAIICNLRNLDRKAASPGGQDPVDIKSDGEDGDEAIPGAGEENADAVGADRKSAASLGNDDESNEDTRDSFASLNIDGDEGRASSSLLKAEAKATRPDDAEPDWHSEGENPQNAVNSATKQLPAQDSETRDTLTEAKPSKPSPSKRGRKLKRKSVGRKFSPETPAIITLDSLISSRSATIKILKEYLREEAKAKRFMVIEDTDLQGVNAKGIPQQNNFSDCGLYLLVYLEAFLHDPNDFTRMIMQREMQEAQEWPRFKGYDLRVRLLKIIQRLHAEQQDKKTSNVEEDKANRDSRSEGYTLIPEKEPSPLGEEVELSSEDEQPSPPKLRRTPKQPIKLPKKLNEFKAAIANKRRPRNPEASNIEGDSIDPLASESPVMKISRKLNATTADHSDDGLEEKSNENRLMAGLQDAAEGATPAADQGEMPATPPPVPPRERGQHSVDTDFVNSPNRSYRRAIGSRETSLTYETDGKNEDEVQMVEHPEQEREEKGRGIS